MLTKLPVLDVISSGRFRERIGMFLLRQKLPSEHYLAYFRLSRFIMWFSRKLVNLLGPPANGITKAHIRTN